MRMLRRGRFRVDDETIRWWGRVSIGSRGCVLEVTEMDGNKAIAPPTKSEQNRSRCNCRSRGGGIVETIIEPGGTGCTVCNSVRGYRTCNCFGSNNVRRKNSVGGHRLDIARYSVTCAMYTLTCVLSIMNTRKQDFFFLITCYTD